MKKKVIKSAFAIACIVAASVSGFKAYDQHDKNAAANVLLAENVEALSAGDNFNLPGWLTNNETHYYLAANTCYVTKVVNGVTQRIPGIYYTCNVCNDPNSTCDFSVTGQCQLYN